MREGRWIFHKVLSRLVSYERSKRTTEPEDNARGQRSKGTTKDARAHRSTTIRDAKGIDGNSIDAPRIQISAVDEEIKFGILLVWHSLVKQRE